MRATLILHVAAGGVAIAAGYLAVLAAKGGALHRRSGTVFAGAMLLMCGGGGALAVVRNAAPRINLPAVLLAAYFVVTSITALRPAGPRWRARHVALMLVALGVGLFDVGLGLERLLAGKALGLLVVPAFVFGTIALIAAAGDWRMLRAGPPAGPVRVARHLWRACFAFFIATGSFFLGQAKVIPPELRVRPVLSVLALAPLGVLLLWLWKVRLRRSVRGLVLAPRPPAAPAR